MTPFQPNPDHNDAALGDARDQSIDRVLHAFRDIAAPTGLESRILHNLQQRALTTPQSNLRPATLWTRLAPWRWSIAVAIPATALVILALTHHARLIPLQSPTEALNQPAIYTTSPRTPSVTRHAAAPTPVALPRPTAVALNTTTPAPQLSPALSAQDQLALEETNAPSLYAPPMPLTAQERLLVRVTRPGAAIEVAELDQLREPILRAAEEARDRARLQHYADGIIAPLLAFPNPDPIPDTPNPTPEDTPPPPK